MLVKIFSALIVGFVSGVFVHSVFFDTSIAAVWLISIMLIAVIMTLVSSHKIISLIAIGLIGFTLGMLRYGATINQYQSSVFDVFASQSETVVLSGQVVSEPVVKINYTEFILETQYVRVADDALDVVTQVLVKTDVYSNYEFGQKILTKGVIEKPTSFITDTEREFDYQQYLAKDHIYYVMSYAESSIIDQGEESIRRSLYALKNTFLKGIYRFIPDPESGLLAGILFGQKSALDGDTEDNFRIVGLMHIVVLSGYNVSLVIQIVTRGLRFLPLAVRSILAVLSIAAFALLVGAGPTVVRASIMAVFIVLAELVGARYNITRALIIAGAIMVLINPRILFFDISFQLSFLATYGLINFSPYLEKKFHRLPSVLAIRNSAVATIAAQIMVVPLIIYSIGEFSLISPVVNVLVLFAVPYAMLVGFITAAIGILVPGLAMIPAYISTALLKYQLWMVDVFAALPFASISFPRFHWVIMIVLYGGIFYWLWNIHIRESSA